MSPAFAALPRRLRAEWLAVGAVLALLGLVLGAALYRDRHALEKTEQERLQGQARVIEENLARQLQGVNNALVGIRDDLKAFGPDADLSATSSKLKLLSDGMPGVRTLAVLDAGGTIVASSRAELVGRNSQRRELFDVPHHHPDRETLYVSAPFKTVLNTFVVAVGRVLWGPREEFAGVVTATLDPDYFNVLLQSVLYAPDMRTTLTHGDGEVFLNVPERADPSGAEPDRMVATRTLRPMDLRMDKALVVSVSRSVSDVFEPWRDKAWRFGIFHAVVLLGSGASLFFSQRRRQALGRMLAAAAEERRHSAERLELALQAADLGLWDLHIPSGNFVANPRELALLGYSPEAELPQLGAWRELIHPDDRAQVDLAMLPHLRGETATFGHEHRMLHRAGHYVWLSSHAMIVERDADGRPLRMVGTHMDITERRRIDAELRHAVEESRRSQAQLRDVTDSLPALVSSIDLQQRFRLANEAYREWLDIEPASLLGRSLREVYGEQAYARLRPHVETALAGQRVVYERELSTPRGLRHVEVTLIPQRRRDGAVGGVYALINDLTQRHAAAFQLARSEARLTLALEGSGLALFDWDIEADQIYHSAQASAMRDDLPADETLSPFELQAFVHPDDLAAMLANIKAALMGTVSEYHAEFRIRRRAGDWLWLRARGRVVERGPDGRALRLAGTYADINERKMADERLRHRAEFDGLTELPNRTVFVERLQLAMSRATPGSRLALLFLDIDHFKTINDTLGHEAGDQLLKVFATRMRDCVRQSDTVARLAGDEFTIILEGLRHVSDAGALAVKLVETLRAPIALAGKLFVITTSVGVALWNEGDADDAELLRRADAALYEAKRRGRNGYFCEDPEATGTPAAALSVSADVVKH